MDPTRKIVQEYVRGLPDFVVKEMRTRVLVNAILGQQLPDIEFTVRSALALLVQDTFEEGK